MKNFFKLILLLVGCLFIQVSSQTNPGLTVGPVIGSTTESTTRILAEFGTTGNITYILRSVSGQTFNKTLNVTAGDPIVFKFENLTAGTYYNVTFDPPVSGQVPSYFKNMNNANPGNLKFALVSYNEYP